MMSFVDLEPGSIVQEHAHPHDQVGMVLKGRATFFIGGEEKTLGPGTGIASPAACGIGWLRSTRRRRCWIYSIRFGKIIGSRACEAASGYCLSSDSSLTLRVRGSSRGA